MDLSKHVQILVSHVQADHLKMNFLFHWVNYWKLLPKDLMLATGKIEWGSHSSMDRVPVSETVDAGSIPAGSTWRKLISAGQGLS